MGSSLVVLGQAGPLPVFALVIAGVVTLIAIGLVAFIVRMYRKVSQGQALIVNTPSGTKVVFTGKIVIPVIHKAEIMDISVKTIEISRMGTDGLICQDNIRADIRVTFFVRVNEAEKDVLRVAKMVGTQRASDRATLEELFGAKFSEALKTAGKKLDFEELYEARQSFRDNIKDLIENDLNGYILEDVAIDYLEQTPVNSLDPNNILDAEGIRKITERTEAQRILTNEVSNNAKKEIGKNNLDTKRALLNYEREESEEEAKQKRAIETIRATERASAEEVKAEQIARERRAQLIAEQEINIQSTNKKREEQIAEKARERALILEQEAIEKERSLTVIQREREVETTRIKKDREVEVEKREIAEVVRDRISVEKGVAQEEEAIRDLRVLAEAERQKKATIIGAEADAEKKLVVDKKAAEADEEVSKYRARQRIVEADAALDAAERTAKAKARIAEGVQAEEAATGLARVRVEEAEAAALEKRGLVEARVLREKMQAEAGGMEEQGMVKVRLRQAHAEAQEREGEATANVKRGTLIAEAEGEEQRGLAAARVKQAQAEAREREGSAEAAVVRERLVAEATGEKEKGFAKAQAEAALAEAIEKKGLAEARVLLEREQAEAAGIEKKGSAKAQAESALAEAIEKKGMAEARVLLEREQAEATGIEKKQLAEAIGIRERLLAEATGIAEKAEAMKAFDERSRLHEEFRLTLEQERVIALERLRTGVELGEAQARVLGSAMASANINIVGGQESFYNNFLKSVELGHTVEGFLDNSSTARQLMERFVGGATSSSDDAIEEAEVLPVAEPIEPVEETPAEA